jgi:hypothetical protein
MGPETSSVLPGSVQQCRRSRGSTEPQPPSMPELEHTEVRRPYRNRNARSLCFQLAVQERTRLCYFDSRWSECKHRPIVTGDWRPTWRHRCCRRPTPGRATPPTLILRDAQVAKRDRRRARRRLGPGWWPRLESGWPHGYRMAHLTSHSRSHDGNWHRQRRPEPRRP